MNKKLLITIPLISITLVIGSVLVYYFSLLSSVKKLKDHYPVYNAKISGYELVAKKPAHWVKLSDISLEAQKAIVISEDWAFYDHDGIDTHQIEIAIKDSLDEGKLTRGASTITQQVVKNALLSNERSLVRKLKEVMLATELEKVLTKDQILEHYLNLIELGKDLYGIKNASQFYFAKQPSELNAKEGAFLAMLLPSPVKYSQSYRDKKLTNFAKEQIDQILVKLRQAKVIDEDKRVIYTDKPLSFEKVLKVDMYKPKDVDYKSDGYEAETKSYEGDVYEYNNQKKEAEKILKDVQDEALDMDKDPEGEY